MFLLLAPLQKGMITMKDKGFSQISMIKNQKYKKLFQTVCEAKIKVTKEAFNLHDCVFTLSDRDY